MFIMALILFEQSQYRSIESHHFGQLIRRQFHFQIVAHALNDVQLIFCIQRLDVHLKTIQYQYQSPISNFTEAEGKLNFFESV